MHVKLKYHNSFFKELLRITEMKTKFMYVKSEKEEQRSYKVVTSMSIEFDLLLLASSQWNIRFFLNLRQILEINVLQNPLVYAGKNIIPHKYFYSSF